MSRILWSGLLESRVSSWLAGTFVLRFDFNVIINISSHGTIILPLFDSVSWHFVFIYFLKLHIGCEEAL